MEILQTILNLSDAEWIRLNQSGINSVNAFLDCDEYNLKKILDTTIYKIREMKENVNEVFKMKVKKGSELLEEVLLKGHNFATSIKNLDDILTAKGIVSGEIIEIIGAPASGKSILMNTIMINILEQHEDLTIVFIDTKYGFSALKFKNIMDNRDIPEVKQVQIMKRIRVERAQSAEDIIKTLKIIVNTPIQHEKLKVIMINSMTVPFYLYLGHTIFRLNLMTDISEAMKLLTKQNISLIVTNLANHFVGTDAVSSTQRSSRSYSSSGSGSSNGGSQKTTKMSIKPALGQYWETIPHHKVLIDFLDYPHNFAADTGERNVSLFASKTAEPSESKIVKITEFGVL